MAVLLLCCCVLFDVATPFFYSLSFFNEIYNKYKRDIVCVLLDGWDEWHSRLLACPPHHPTHFYLWSLFVCVVPLTFVG